MVLSLTVIVFRSSQGDKIGSANTFTYTSQKPVITRHKHLGKKHTIMCECVNFSNELQNHASFTEGTVCVST